MNLSGNTILITGGSAGIGLALAKKFVELGNKVIVTGRNEAKLAATKEATPSLETYACDVSDVQAISALAGKIAEDFPALNVLVNNAGIYVGRNLTTSAKGPQGLAELSREVDININGTVQTTSAFVDLLKKNQGTVINVSSGLAFVPMMAAPLYCATKAFIHSYTTTLRYQLKDVGVDVVELAPPAVKTEMTAELPEDGDFKMLTTEALVDATVKGLRAGKKEIRPGQSNQLRIMARLAPTFIENQLAKGSRAFMPPPEDV